MELAELMPWIERWATVWGTSELPGSLEMTIAPRLRSTLGRCHPATAEIRLNPRLIGHPELLREVACHEAAHVAVFRLHGRRVRPHGPEWKRLMVLAGYAPRARMPVERLPEELRRAGLPRAGYMHRCRSCGATRGARRRMRHWYCRRCHDAGRGGSLEIKRIPLPGVAVRASLAEILASE